MSDFLKLVDENTKIIALVSLPSELFKIPIKTSQNKSRKKLVLR
jgi:hypothetical protein